MCLLCLDIGIVILFNFSVVQVNTNVMEIDRLVKVFPNPCGTIEQFDKFIRQNITVLRNQIAKAKLLASYLQVSHVLLCNMVFYS